MGLLQGVEDATDPLNTPIGRAWAEQVDFFRLSLAEACDVASRMAFALSGWRRQAHADGISEASIDYMAGCFEVGVRKLRALSR